MAQIFETSPGMVVAITNNNRPVLPLTIGDFNTAGTQNNCLITGLAIQRSSAFQVLHTTDSLYIYSFREKVGALRVTGMTFPKSCNTASPTSGQDAALIFFDQSRLDVAQGPSLLQIGANASFYGYLSDMQTEINDPMSMVGQFAFNFLLLPPARRTG